MINTYYIGGSPCSEKSTIAEIVSKRVAELQNSIL